MQIIIDLPEETYNHIHNGGNEQPFDTEFCWTCGTDMRGRNEF